MPKTLLINISRNADSNAAKVEIQQPNITRDPSVNAISNGNKIKVMKRSTSGNNMDQKGKTAETGSSSIVDKEKAYAEARARIFAEESASPNESSKLPLDVDSGIQGSPVLQIAETASPTIEANISSPKVVMSSSPASVSTYKIAARPSNQTIVQPNLVQNQRKQGFVKGGRVDPGQWKGNKAITRDRGAEMIDPDFTRNSYNMPQSYQYPVAPPQPYGIMDNQYAYVDNQMPSMESQYYRRPPQPIDDYRGPPPMGYGAYYDPNDSNAGSFSRMRNSPLPPPPSGGPFPPASGAAFSGNPAYSMARPQGPPSYYSDFPPLG